MGQKINVTVNVQVVGGRNLSENQALEVDAVDSIDVELEKKGGPGATKSIEVHPSEKSEKIKLFVVAAKQYDGKVTYKLSDTKVILDAPHVLIGAGVANLLGKNSQKIEFSNEGTEKASITILVGRAAT